MANTIKLRRSAVTGAVPTTAQLDLGELAINTHDGKLFLKRDNGIGQYIVEVGGNLGFEVKNQTGSTIPKGTVLKFAGTLGASGKLLAAPFLANNTDPSEYVIGLAENDILNGDDGFAIDHGKILQLNTSAFSAGAILYASASVAGGLTATRPAAPNNKVIVAAVVRSHATTGILEIKVVPGSALDNDELVELDTLTAGDTLVWNATTGRFENQQGGGGITYSLKTANYTAEDKDGILADTTAGTFTVTLPASPAIGASVVINDAADSFGTNNLIVARNGSTIETIADNLILDLSSISVSFIYTGTTWQVYSLIVTQSIQSILKADLDADNFKIIDANLQRYTEVVTSVTAVSNIITLNLSSGNVFTVTLTANSTLAFSNPPSAGVAMSVTLVVTQGSGGNFTLTYPVGVSFTDSVLPILATTAGKRDVLTFLTVDGGSTYMGGQALANI